MLGPPAAYATTTTAGRPLLFPNVDVGSTTVNNTCTLDPMFSEWLVTPNVLTWVTSHCL